MTPEAQNIAIAESLGWTAIESTGTTGGWLAHHPDIGTRWDRIFGTRELAISGTCPNYHSSLDACAEFEAKLSRYQRIVYGHLLCELVLTEPPDFDTSDITRWNYAGITSVSDVLSATAPQRCEAYLRTMSLWQESK